MTVGALSDPEAVQKAIDEFDRIGRDAFLQKYGYGSALEWVVVQNGREYDSKAIIGVAHGYEFGEPLANSDFSGGLSSAVRKLRSLGFSVQSKSTDRRSFIFQSNPKYFDIAKAVRSLREMNWTVAQDRKLIHAGDHVYIWQSGPGGGVIAEGTVLTDPAMLPDQEGREFIHDQEKFAGEQLRVRISIDRVLDAPLERSSLLSHPVLKDLTIIRFANSTNYHITPEQDAGLQALIAGGEPHVPTPEAARRFWWVNQGASFDRSREGGYLWAPNHDSQGHALSHWSALTEAEPGDLVLNYANGAIRATSSVLERARAAQRPSDHDQQWESDGQQLPVEYRELPETVALTAIPEQWRIAEEGPFNRTGNVKQGYFFPLSEEFVRKLAQRFPHLGIETETSHPRFGIETVREAAERRGLRLAEGIYATVVAALKSGKHVIFTGAPGTAKTTLAQAVAESAAEAGLCTDYVLTTATADWTTYETIGGLRPKTDGSLEFEEGHFLAAIRGNRWLVIDELNRSNFDRAFGQLFTVLSGQPVVLPYTRPGEKAPLTLVPAGASAPSQQADVLAIPDSWRVIATMNVFDKSLLFEMSYALMRRFAFIEIAAPEDDVFEELIDEWAEGDEGAADATKSLLALRAIKDIGPAAYRDMARYAKQRHQLGSLGRGQLCFECFYSYLLPQFEGVSDEEGERLFRAVSLLAGSGLRNKVRKTLNAVLGLELQAPTEQEAQDELGLESEGEEGS